MDIEKVIELLEENITASGFMVGLHKENGPIYHIYDDDGLGFSFDFVEKNNRFLRLSLISDNVLREFLPLRRKKLMAILKESDEMQELSHRFSKLDIRRNKEGVPCLYIPVPLENDPVPEEFEELSSLLELACELNTHIFLMDMLFSALRARKKEKSSDKKRVPEEVERIDRAIKSGAFIHARSLCQQSCSGQDDCPETI